MTFKMRPIYLYSIYKSLEIIEHKSISSCAKLMFPDRKKVTGVQGIMRSLTSHKHDKHSYRGYIFFYDDGKRIPPSDIALSIHRRNDNLTRKVGDKNWKKLRLNWDARKRVVAWNDTGERYIFNSLTEAADNVYGSISNIGRVLTNQNKGYKENDKRCKKRLTAYGYYWDYLD